jgi:hypothetical protein
MERGYTNYGSKIGKTFINYLKTMKQGEHEIDNLISNIIK